MDYSPFNAIIWLIFAGFVAVAYLTVKTFHAKYPDYPNEVNEEKNTQASGFGKRLTRLRSTGLNYGERRQEK
jgi:hypothetical protein